MDVMGARFQRAILRMENPEEDVFATLANARRDANIQDPHHGALYHRSIHHIASLEAYCTAAQSVSKFEIGVFTAEIPTIQAMICQAFIAIENLDSTLYRPLYQRIDQLNNVLDFRHLEQVAKDRDPTIYVSGSLDLLLAKKADLLGTNFASSILKTSCDEHVLAHLAAVQQIFIQAMNHFVKTRADIIFGKEDDEAQDHAEAQLLGSSRARPDFGEGSFLRAQFRFHGIYSYQTAEGIWGIQIGETDEMSDGGYSG